MLLDLNNPKNSQIPYEFYHMPDGQPHIKIDTATIGNSILSVTCSITSMNDLGKLMVAKDALDNHVKETDLYIPYFLGARQDRRQNGEALTVKLIANVINSLNFTYVSVLHPHSDAVLNCLEGKVIEKDHKNYVSTAIQDFKPDFLIIPDAGAAKNAQKYLTYGLPMVQCMKQRDVKTGKLSGFRVVDEVPEGKGMIVDDICDGGGTFLGLAGLFPTNRLALYTTHGIYSKGLKALNTTFEKIYTTDSYHYNGFPVEIDDQAKKKTTVYMSCF